MYILIRDIFSMCIVNYKISSVGYFILLCFWISQHTELGDSLVQSLGLSFKKEKKYIFTQITFSHKVRPSNWLCPESFDKKYNQEMHF